MGQETEKIYGKLAGSKSITLFLEENKAALVQGTIGEYIQQEIKKRKISKKQIIKHSGINKRYFIEILSGAKSPHQRYIIRIFLALGLELKDVQWYLKASGYPQLYARNKKDSIIIYCIDHKLSVAECNAMLNKVGLENLGFENL